MRLLTVLGCQDAAGILWNRHKTSVALLNLSEGSGVFYQPAR